MVVTNDWQWLKTQIILIKQIWETHFLFSCFFLSFIDSVPAGVVHMQYPVLSCRGQKITRQAFT